MENNQQIDLKCKMAKYFLQKFILNVSLTKHPLYFRDNKDTVIFLIVVMAFLLLAWRTQESYLPRRERSVEWNYQLSVW